MTSIGPSSAARVSNEYYRTEEEFVWACADAMHEECKAIVEAGLILQIDDPSIAENWDQINPEPTVTEYQRFTMTRVEALNHALRGLPQDRVRFHLCWGSWHGPHTTDIQMRGIVEVMLAINAGGYSFEAANARHEHEWTVWRDVPLPEGKVILPGIVSHATNVVEHPELVAQRITRFAEVVGRENVIASTDCGLGGRIHADIAWAKLETLVRVPGHARLRVRDGARRKGRHARPRGGFDQRRRGIPLHGCGAGNRCAARHRRRRGRVRRRGIRQRQRHTAARLRARDRLLGWRVSCRPATCPRRPADR
jgi:5-methyltetrahydropteroyltriglutamate--homocysteine methyltransferase